MNPATILKFGGSSVATSSEIFNTLSIIQKAAKQSRIGVVVSALGGVTNQLIELYVLAGKQKRWQGLFEEVKERHSATLRKVGEESVLKELKELFLELGTVLTRIETLQDRSLKAKDEVMSFGERLSIRILASALTLHGNPAYPADTSNLVVTDGTHGSAKVYLELSAEKIQHFLIGREEIPVFSGFIGRSKRGEITTIGRSGSDFTAGIIGYAIDAQRVEIWTDVSGVYTTDPNVIDSAVVLPQLSYRYMERMAEAGAKVLHPKTVYPLHEKGIPFVIKNTFDPLAEGTFVGLEIPTSTGVIRTLSTTKELTGMRYLKQQGKTKPFEDMSCMVYLEQHAEWKNENKTHLEWIIQQSRIEENQSILDGICTKGWSVDMVDKLTLVTSTIFSTDELGTLLTELYKEWPNSIRGYRFESPQTLSIYVESNVAKPISKKVHDDFCLYHKQIIG